MTTPKEPESFSLKSIGNELVQPFIDLFHAPRVLWGINISYLIEGITYFGMVNLLAMYFNKYVGLNDIDAGWMVGFLTAGITLAMLFLGAAVDWIGLRKSLLVCLGFMLVGRVLLVLAPQLGAEGVWASSHWIAMGGLVALIIGNGIYQPACYAGVKEVSTGKTATMGYAMLYAFMNLGAFLPGLISPPVRKRYDIIGVYSVYVVLTVVGMIVVAVFITRKAMEQAKKTVLLESEPEEIQQEKDDAAKLEEMSAKERLAYYMKNFPLADGRFMFFIFILIPVQTLFAHNWLTIPLYTRRAFEGFVSENFEFFSNLSPLLVFVLTPMIAALTSKKDTYKMMISGTFVMALPTFFLAIGPNIYALFAYLIVMTIGETMWQPRFLQWVAEIAPKNMTGIYMGIGQFPWFMTKIITSLYSGWFLMHYCPDETAAAALNTQTMWMIYGGIAMISPIALFLCKGWMAHGMRKAD